MSYGVNARVPLFAIFSAGSIAAFALLARAVARRDTAPIDHEVHEQTKIDKGEPGRETAEKVSPIGKWWTYVPAAALTGTYVFARRGEERDDQSRVAGMVTIIAAAAIAASVNHLFDDLLPQPPPPPGRPPDHPVFPSGHAFGTMSVAMTAAYVLSREELAHAAVVLPIALIVPVVSSAARMIEEKHWVSDVIGGYLAAMGLSFAAVSVYEAVIQV
jgi:membrane-associated phospholipid phosphatase